MDRHNLVEIKAGQEGTGLLMENDGYISLDCGQNKKLFESINSEGMDKICPEHFIVDAVFQKYGIENANGRIYPENVLKREVEKYMERVRQHWAYGECYRPEAMILTESGWKYLYELVEGEKVLTLNPNTNKIEIHPIDRIVKYHHTGKMIRIKGKDINDLVTPEHGFPVFDSEHNFKKFVTASEIKDQSLSNYYIPTLKDGIYLDKNFIEVTEEEYDGDVMCVEVPNHIWYVMDNNKCHWTKNCNHPSESVIDLSRIAINIVELHWEGHTLVGKLEIITSPGFRKHGIISCQGDQIANILLSGLKIGVSSRGLGTVTQKMGVLYVSDDFSLVCWDCVSEPSTPGAFIGTSKEEIQVYVEDKSSINKTQLFEKLDNFNDWLNE